jgi:hypothetical protein
MENAAIPNYAPNDLERFYQHIPAPRATRVARILTLSRLARYIDHLGTALDLALDDSEDYLDPLNIWQGKATIYCRECDKFLGYRGELSKTAMWYARYHECVPPLHMDGSPFVLHQGVGTRCAVKAIWSACSQSPTVMLGIGPHGVCPAQRGCTEDLFGSGDPALQVCGLVVLLFRAYPNEEQLKEAAERARDLFGERNPLPPNAIMQGYLIGPAPDWS